MLAELFPGLIDELGAAGAVVIDDGDLSRLYAGGPLRAPTCGHVDRSHGGDVVPGDATFVESHVHRRVANLPNVRFLEGHEVIEPLTEANAIAGVRIVQHDNGTPGTWPPIWSSTRWAGPPAPRRF